MIEKHYRSRDAAELLGRQHWPAGTVPFADNPPRLIAKTELPRSTADDLAWIYFIQHGAGGPIKIGIAKDVERRLASLQSASPVPLHVLGAVRGTERGERQLHLRFAKHRIRGEWFQPVEDLLRYVERTAA